MFPCLTIGSGGDTIVFVRAIDSCLADAGFGLILGDLPLRWLAFGILEY